MRTFRTSGRARNSGAVSLRKGRWFRDKHGGRRLCRAAPIGNGRLHPEILATPVGRMAVDRDDGGGVGCHFEPSPLTIYPLANHSVSHKISCSGHCVLRLDLAQHAAL